MKRMLNNNNRNKRMSLEAYCGATAYCTYSCGEICGVMGR
jgi:hypothetical protein